MPQVALHVDLRLLAVRGRRQRHHPERARADPFRERPDGSSFSGTVTPFEHDDDAQALLFDPALKVAQLDLQLSQFLLVRGSFHGRGSDKDRRLRRP